MRIKALPLKGFYGKSPRLALWGSGRISRKSLAYPAAGG